MRELMYTDDTYAIYEKLDDDTVRCVALMDFESAPELTITETEEYARMFVAAPKMREELKAVLTLLEQGQPLDPEHDGARIKALLKDMEG